MNNIRLLEYFFSIDGETKRSGELVWFIRVSGCGLRCIWCDTDWCHYDKGIETDIDELVNTIESTNDCKKVTLTGGEPLMHPNISKLILRLLKDGFDVNIETNGSINPYKVLDKKIFGKYRRTGQLWFSMDYKCPYSGMNDKMISGSAMAYVLGKHDCCKFVVANEGDLLSALHRIKLMERYYRERKVPQDRRCTYYLSPCFGEIELPDIIEFMKTHELYDRVRFQLQQHKIIWSPTTQGV